MDRDESKETNNYKSSLLQIRLDKLTGNYRERKDEKGNQWKWKQTETNVKYHFICLQLAWEFWNSLHKEFINE